MITRAIIKAFEDSNIKNWDKTYWAFDIHETILRPTWSSQDIPMEFYPNAKEALQLISKRRDITRILFTCSHPHEIKKYLKLFRENDIRFDYVNENPEVISKKYGCYEKKPYFNVLFEDKAGFDPMEDWFKVLELLKTNKENKYSSKF